MVGPMSFESVDLEGAKRALQMRARELGFDALGVARLELPEDERHLLTWLEAGYHGEMNYMERHGALRSRPAELAPGSVRVISVRMNYWPEESQGAQQTLADAELGYVSRYALGRDYHKVMRANLARLATELCAQIGRFGYRVCVDSAPVLEKALARNAGLGWIGKHTNLIARDAGSWFFLGEILTDLPLPADAAASAHCGTCSACIPACPTAAIIAPYRLDARRCISYLTIESKESIPLELRTALGNRIYGCDDCQIVCPWNKFARAGRETKLAARDALHAPPLAELARLDEQSFRTLFTKSAVKRIGRARFLRNVLIAIGNAEDVSLVPEAERLVDDASPLVRGAAIWALGRLDRARLRTLCAERRARESDPDVVAEWDAACRE